MEIRDLKLDMLKEELRLNSQKVNHFDDLRLKTRQMGLTLWLASLGVGITSKFDLILLLGAVIPLPFWYFDAVYQSYQKGFNLRFIAIQKFIRSGHYKVKDKIDVYLEECMKSENFGDFPIPDSYGVDTIPEKNHKKATSVKRNFFKKKKLIFYLPQMIAALVLAWILR